MKEDLLLYVTGTAGCGKSTLSGMFNEWCDLRGLNAVIVNLDPGADTLPYEPDVDIRDWVDMEGVMSEYGLGPNGAQIACADMIALNLGEVKECIDGFKSDFTVVDTPGQLELFAFRESGKAIVEGLKPDRSMVCYVVDPFLGRSAPGFASQLLLGMTSNFRLAAPQLNVLSKCDMLTEEERERLLTWSKDPQSLYSAVLEEEPSVYHQLSEGIIRLLEDCGGYTSFIPVAREGLEGVEDVYTVIQQQFFGGVDVLKD